MKFAAAVALLVLAALLVVSAGTAADHPIPDFAAEGYVGPDACRSCHVGLHDRWSVSAHATSTSLATPANFPPEMAEGKSASHPPMTSDFRREGDQVFVTTTGPDGERHEYPLTHVVGTERVSFFLTRMDDGRLQVLPSMREIPTGKWFDYTELIFGVAGVPFEQAPVVAPGEPSFWTGPIRSYDRTCGRCHTSGRQVQTTLPDGTPRLEWSPLEIDCEACHGPGAEHVAFWKNPPSEWRPDPYLKLGSLGRDRDQAVCLWCHMEAEVINPNWRPGDDVFEFLSPTLLDNIERIDAAGRPLELVYDGLPFLFSRCAEEGGLTCISCHDAHGTSATADLLVPPERTFTLCTGCHTEIAANAKAHTHHDMDGSGGRCVACHMPYLTIERGHGIVRDHTIGSPMPDLRGGRVAVDACTWCHQGMRGAPEGVPLLTDLQIRESFAEWYPDAGLSPSWVEAIALGRDRDPNALFPLVRTADDDELPRAVRASAARLLAWYPDGALPYLLNLLSDDDSLVRRSAAWSLGYLVHPDADAGLIMACGDESMPVRVEAARTALTGWDRVRQNRRLLDAVLPVLLEDAEAVPWEDSRWFRLGAARQIAGDVKGAVEAYDRKLALDPYASLVRRTTEELRALLDKE